MQVYPTSVRSLGMGVANGFSRIGAIVSPFIAVALVQAGQLTLAEALFALCCIAAAVATVLLPIETKGRALQATVEMAEVKPAALVPQLQRESPQHSSVFQANVSAYGHRLLFATHGLHAFTNACPFTLQIAPSTPHSSKPHAANQ